MNPNDNTPPTPPTTPTPQVDAQPQPSTSPAFEPPKSRKKLLIILGVVGGLLLIGGIVAAIALSRGDSPLSEAIKTATGSGSADVVNRSDGTLSLQNTVDGQSSLKNQDIKANLNQQVNLSDGFSFMVSDVSPVASFQRTFGGRVNTVQPDSGNEFVQLTIVAGNRRSGEGTMSFSPFTFTVAHAQDNTKYLAETFLLSDNLTPEGYYSLNMDALSSGMQQEFILYYEVPQGAPLYIEVERKYSNFSGDAEDVVLKGRVTLR